MNILPKKRWHVRTKDNIARVRKDEALAAEEEKKKQMRIQIAEREARTEALRSKARQQYSSYIPLQSPKNKEPESSSNQHVNLFHELEHNEIVSNKTNEEYEKEKKLEKEKYEKQIGYLTYLGQDTNEITGQVSWYNKPREEILGEEEKEVSKKQKVFEDPLEDIRKYLGCEGIKKVKESVEAEKKEIKDLIKKRKHSEVDSSFVTHKKHKKEKKSKHKKKKKKHKRKHSSESEKSDVEEVKKQENVDLERLRAERIRREREERKRADELFAKLSGIAVKKEETEPETLQKYNSQFNPHLAKQNYEEKGCKKEE